MTTRYHDTLKLLGPIEDDDDAVNVKWVREHAGEGGPGTGMFSWEGFIGPPPSGSLKPLALGLQYDGDPVPWIWVGVPLSVDPTGRRMLYPPPSLVPPPVEGTIWDDGTTLWDVNLGGTLWDVPTLWYDNGVLTVWDNGNTSWDY